LNGVLLGAAGARKDDTYQLFFCVQNLSSFIRTSTTKVSTTKIFPYFLRVNKKWFFIEIWNHTLPQEKKNVESLRIYYESFDTKFFSLELNLL